MRLTSIVGLAASLLAAPLAGCGEHHTAAAPTETPGVPGVNASLTFAVKGPLKLEPGANATLAVVTTPPDRYALQFRLVGESLDASLDTSKAVADEDGVAFLSLRAPNQATTFAVRATIEGGPSADLVVSVSGQGYATLDIVPDYPGSRPVESWVASAVMGTTCAALGAKLPDDPEGALTVSAPFGAAVLLPDAPVGPSLAVAVRTSRYAWGCTDVSGLMAGSVTKVVVHVADKPVDSSASDLDVSLELVPEPTSWDALLAESRAAMLARFQRKGTEAETLLDAIVNVAPDADAALAAAESHGWLTTLESLLAEPGKSPSTVVAQLAESTLPALPPIVGRAKGIDAHHALFRLDGIGPLAANASGGPTEYLMKLSVDSKDQVHLGGALYLLPSRFVGASLDLAAASATPPSNDVPDHLAARLGCDTLALDGLPNCDAACLAKLCRHGLASIWADALDASATLGLPAQVMLNATGSASYDTEARLVGFSGQWLGQAQCGSLAAKLSGAAVAVPVESPDAN
jgi:hypothetical protein